jgi:tetratricopeptide (TPR) repeat protein
VSLDPPALAEPKGRKGPLWKTWVPLAILALAVVLVWSSAKNWFGLASGRPTPEAQITVLGFAKTAQGSGYGDIADAITAGLTEALKIGGGLQVTPAEESARLRLDLHLPPGGTYAERDLKLVRENTGAAFIISGSFEVNSSSEIALTIFLQDTNSGRMSAAIHKDAAQDDLSGLIAVSTAAVRRRLNLPQLPAKDQKLLRQALPSNTDALRLYGQGMQDLYVWKYAAASEVLASAAAKEDSYAPAHAGLARALFERGYTDEAISQIRMALNESQQLPPNDALAIEAEYYEIESEWSKARDAYLKLFNLDPGDLEYALAAARLENPPNELNFLKSLSKLPHPEGSDPRIDLERASVESAQRNYSAARLAAEAAAIKAREREAQDVLAKALVVQAVAERRLGQRARAASLYTEAQRIATLIGDRDTETDCIRSLAAMDVDAGELMAAARNYEEALAIGHGASSLRITAASAAGLGHVRLEQGNLAQAQRYLVESLNLMRSQQLYAEVPNEEIYLGELLLQQGDLQKADQMTRDAISALSNTHGRPQAEALTILTRICMEQGSLNRARQAIDEALQIASGLSDQYPRAMALLIWGELAQERGDSKDARERYSRALGIFSTLGLKTGIAEARLGLAQLDLDEGNATHAVGLAREALSEFQREGRTTDSDAARALEADADLVRGRISLAAAALRPALQHRIQNRLISNRVAITAARIEAATGRRAKSIADLRGMIYKDKRDGLIRCRLRAEAALASIDPNFNTASIVAEATEAGFGQIAQQARAVQTRRHWQ